MYFMCMMYFSNNCSDGKRFCFMYSSCYGDETHIFWISNFTTSSTTANLHHRRRCHRRYHIHQNIQQLDRQLLQNIHYLPLYQCGHVWAISVGVGVITWVTVYECMCVEQLTQDTYRRYEWMIVGQPWILLTWLPIIVLCGCSCDPSQFQIHCLAE